MTGLQFTGRVFPALTSPPIPGAGLERSLATRRAASDAPFGCDGSGTCAANFIPDASFLLLVRRQLGRCPFSLLWCTVPSSVRPAPVVQRPGFNRASQSDHNILCAGCARRVATWLRFRLGSSFLVAIARRQPRPSRRHYCCACTGSSAGAHSRCRCSLRTVTACVQAGQPAPDVQQRPGLSCSYQTDRIESPAQATQQVHARWERRHRPFLTSYRACSCDRGCSCAAWRDREPTCRGCA